jgi:putative membrane protein
MIKKRATYLILFLLIFHTIGIIIFTSKPEAANLSWLNLLLSGLVLFISEKFSLRTLAVFLLIFIGGYTVELIGVHTGYLFGEYSYGANLGTKLFGIPLIIGINWYAIVLSSSNLIKKIKLPLIVKAIIAGILCTVMDFFIEPIAIQYDFWSWQGEIPLYNYICWFLFSTLFSLIYLSDKQRTNKPALALYPIWLSFFLILNIL